MDDVDAAAAATTLPAAVAGSGLVDTGDDCADLRPAYVRFTGGDLVAIGSGAAGVECLSTNGREKLGQF